jgi:hypothetical protein
MLRVIKTVISSLALGILKNVTQVVQLKKCQN